MAIVEFLSIFLKEIVIFLKSWFWLILLVFLYFLVKFFYLWWLRWEIWYKKRKWIVLEVIPPGEIEKPYRAMEDFYNTAWGVYDKPNWRERECEGEFPIAPFWFSIEIVSWEGKIHFYFRIEQANRRLIESALYAHYPEIEIKQVPDYLLKLPKNLPTQEWDLYGEDFVFLKPDPYPIKTYKFFEQRPEDLEVKKLDPIYSFLESASCLKEGEIYIFQIIISPILNIDIPWIDQGREIADQIAKRPKKEKGPKTLFGHIFRTLFPPKKEPEPKEIIPPEMKLTPGEREILSAIEEKISKTAFKVNLRGVYIYKKTAFNKAHRALARSYLSHFATENLNKIIHWGKTRTRIHYWFRKRRLYLRKKRMFEFLVERFPPRYPKLVGPGNLILNSEELATIFHFPLQARKLPPTVPRVEFKRGEPPTSLPTF